MGTERRCNKMDINVAYEYMANHIAPESLLNCITAINGYNMETINDVLYYFTGYRSLEQYLQYEDFESFIELIG